MPCYRVGKRRDRKPAHSEYLPWARPFNEKCITEPSHHTAVGRMRPTQRWPNSEVKGPAWAHTGVSGALRLQC